jgi:hypothetical protein
MLIELGKVTEETQAIEPGNTLDAGQYFPMG